jgi:hypothetical protein
MSLVVEFDQGCVVALAAEAQRSALESMSQKTRIMYIENKSDGLVGPARIGRVTFSKTGKSITYRGKEFSSLKGTGFKANFWIPETGEQYWISGCKKDGLDSLYPNEIEIDEDVREEYWITIRNRADQKKKPPSNVWASIRSSLLNSSGAQNKRLERTRRERASLW